MNLLTRYMNFGHVRANSARMLLQSALPQSQVWICEEDYQEVQNIMKTIIYGSRCWMDNTSKQRQQSVNDLWFCKYSNYTVIWLLLCITDVLAAFISKRDSNTVTIPFCEWASTERQRSLNDLWFCKYCNYSVIWSLLCITDQLPAFKGKWDSNTGTATFEEWASTQRQQFVVL